MLVLSKSELARLIVGFLCAVNFRNKISEHACPDSAVFGADGLWMCCDFRPHPVYDGHCPWRVRTMRSSSPPLPSGPRVPRHHGSSLWYAGSTLLRSAKTANSALQALPQQPNQHLLDLGPYPSFRMLSPEAEMLYTFIPGFLQQCQAEPHSQSQPRSKVLLRGLPKISHLKL